MESYGIYSRRNSNSEQKEVDKYIKFFALKSLQSVVQSRDGIKSKTKCNPTAKGLDWFNIKLSDGEANMKLQGRIREIFGKKIPGIMRPICVDIVLKTVEGSFTVLETWQLTTDIQTKEQTMKNHFSIYNRLGILLKSVIAISRLLPSYHLSRKTEHDFMLFFKVHTELYPLHHFELHNSIHIGSVHTPSGTLSIKVLYRNKIWLSGSMHAHTYVINDTEMLFPLSSEKDIDKSSFQSVEMLENEIAIAASDMGTCFPDWFSPLSSQSSEEVHKDICIVGQQNIDTLQKQMIFSGPSVGHVGEKLRPVAAFVEPTNIDGEDLPNLDLLELPSTPPFHSLLQDPNVKDNNITENGEKMFSHSSENIERKSQPSLPNVPRTAEAVGFEDDFVLVELRPTFGSDDDSVGSLYRQCQSPAALDMFASLEREDREGQSIDLDDQLEKYRKELQEYEDFFKILKKY